MIPDINTLHKEEKEILDVIKPRFQDFVGGLPIIQHVNYKEDESYFIQEIDIATENCLVELSICRYWAVDADLFDRVSISLGWDDLNQELTYDSDYYPHMDVDYICAYAKAVMAGALGVCDAETILEHKKKYENKS